MSDPIYEHLPPGFEGPSNLLRSLPHPPQKAYVRFFNTTNRHVAVKWVDFDGKLKHYRTLGHSEFFDCDTFVDHYWVFRDVKTNDAMCVNRKEVFVPEAIYAENNGNAPPLPYRVCVKIHRPVLSLLILSARVVRNSLRDITEPYFLELPFHLQTLVSKLILDFWEANPEKRSNSQFVVPEDPENIILKRDWDDFQCNITYIGYRLSLHAKKLLSVARKVNGKAAGILVKILETIIVSLGYEVTYEVPDSYARKLAPVIWKQMIFLRIHLDNLQVNCGPPWVLELDTFYSSLIKMAKRRLALMLPEAKNSYHCYHWEQLSLLMGDSDVKSSKKVKDDPAYDIPELKPLSQRPEWEWIELRRSQLRDHPCRDTVAYFFRLTAHMLRITNRLENTFQLLCIYHFHLLGHHITDETIEKED